jgi:hypothetical protein
MGCGVTFCELGGGGGLVCSLDPELVYAKKNFQIGKFAKTSKVIALMLWDYLQGSMTKEAD